MESKVSIVIKDIWRWTIVLTIIPLLLIATEFLIRIGFTWVISFSSNWSWIFHTIFYVIIGAFMMGCFISVALLLFQVLSIIIRQYVVFLIVLFVTLSILAGYSIYNTWSSSFTYKWELFDHPLTNKVFFTMLNLITLSIPFTMYENYLEAREQKNED